MTAPTPSFCRPFTYAEAINPDKNGSSEKDSEAYRRQGGSAELTAVTHDEGDRNLLTLPFPGCLEMLHVGPRSKLTPLALASLASIPPSRAIWSTSNVAASAVPHGAQLAGVIRR